MDIKENFTGRDRTACQDISGIWGSYNGRRIERISSQELSDIMKATASQIRQDFKLISVGFWTAGIWIQGRIFTI